jgi:hypothetical protein
MPRKKPGFDLTTLNHIAKALAETKDLKEVKAIRDKAEAVRKYAQSAALSQQIQNQAAELKLQAERRAGDLLNELVPHGGDRSSHHDGDLQLSDLGINSNQSSRWRREAAVPEKVFQEFVSAANELGRDITTQGLLRLERVLSSRQRRRRKSKRDIENRPTDSQTSEGNGVEPRPTAAKSNAPVESMSELLAELANHRDALARILKPLCDGADADLRTPERRLIDRLLSEIGDLVHRLERMLPGDSVR